MEADGIIDADADIERVLRLRLQQGDDTDIHRAENAALVVGVSSHDDWNETTPLLGKDKSSSSTPDQVEASSVVWAGGADFDGLPWYKKPSVCVVWSFGAYIVAYVHHRFTGFFPHSYCTPLPLEVL